MKSLVQRLALRYGEFRERGTIVLLAMSLSLVSIALAVASSGVLARIDHLVYDFGQRFGHRLAAENVVLVAIDEDSLARIGRWPWPRDVHARALEEICAAEPAAVGFDVAFSEPGGDPGADAALARSVAACGRVVLPLVIETASVGGQVLETPPLPELVSAAAGLGRVGVRLDDDGIARSVDLREGVGFASWPLFAAELLRVAQGQPVQQSSVSSADIDGGAHDLLRQDERRIAFSGPPGSIPRISFAQILDGRVPREMFAGKIVLVGATAVGLGDFLPTPVSAKAQPMPGVEVQGHVLLSLQEDRLSRPLPRRVSALCCAVLALLPLLWLPRLMPLAGLLVSALWILLLVGFSAMLPLILRVYFAPTGAILAGLLAYPLWSWHRLEAARRHLDQELHQLGVQAGTDGTAWLRMGFEERIAAVQAAQRKLQDLETQRNEALAFISHDLRSPLASAVQWLEREPVCDSARLLPSLRRAQAMAQGFLQLARAEALDQRRMNELDLVSVLEQAADELYPLAVQQGRRIRRSLPDAPVWIKGDFAALERCAINLLQNALSYAPKGEPIGVELDFPHAVSAMVRFSVVNAGPAFSVEQKARLFRRYSRGEGVSSNAQGAGLGLYYVHTVAEKHSGSAGVECEDGIVRFWVSLPALEI